MALNGQTFPMQRITKQSPNFCQPSRNDIPELKHHGQESAKTSVETF